MLRVLKDVPRVSRGLMRMGTARRLGLKFKERDPFGRFCVALTEDHVPFSHRGYQTVVLAQTQLRQLPTASRKLFEEFKIKGLLVVFPTTSVGKRPPLPTAREAKELLRQFITLFACICRRCIKALNTRGGIFRLPSKCKMRCYPCRCTRS